MGNGVGVTGVVGNGVGRPEDETEGDGLGVTDAWEVATLELDTSAINAIAKTGKYAAFLGLTLSSIRQKSLCRWDKWGTFQGPGWVPTSCHKEPEPAYL